jgi:hypothetical protein
MMSKYWFNSSILMVFAMIFLQCSADAQFGVRLKYNFNNYNNWENTLVHRFSVDQKLFSKGYEAGLDYWFRLKKRRIEFMPEISYSNSSTSFNNPTIDKFNIDIFSFNFNTQIYALDMEGDCDCPTFSKQGPSLNKGLFFHFTPGLGYFRASGTPQAILSSVPLPNGLTSGFVFRAGTGIGLDIGVSDLFTLTPIISYYFHSGMNWEQLAVKENLPVNSTNNLGVLQVTLRLGFRPDYMGSGRKFRR